MAEDLVFHDPSGGSEPSSFGRIGELAMLMRLVHFRASGTTAFPGKNLLKLVKEAVGHTCLIKGKSIHRSDDNSATSFSPRQIPILEVTCWLQERSYFEGWKYKEGSAGPLYFSESAECRTRDAV